MKTPTFQLYFQKPVILVIDSLLFFTHYSLLLAFGILLAFAFSGVRITQKKNIVVFAVLFIVCGLIQLSLHLSVSDTLIRKLYPLITHLPTILVISLYYKKRLITAIAALTTSYLCCQPAKWFGLLSYAIFKNPTAELIARITVLSVAGILILKFFAEYIAEIFGTNTKSVVIFSIVPTVYYVFEYTTAIYTDFWTSFNPIVAEFLPFFLCVVFFVFCIVYYKEQELKANAERKEQIISVTVMQQQKEIEAIRRSEQEIKILRHDMRLLLNNLAMQIENNDTENALKTIYTYNEQIEATAVHRYCENNILNYILSGFEEKCSRKGISFKVNTNIDTLGVDEIMFSSILSNALDNAVNAQENVMSHKFISVLIKHSNGKLLLSVENPYSQEPQFADGLPITDKQNHGYGTQSIRYMTRKLGGNCQFSTKDGNFFVRVII